MAEQLGTPDAQDGTGDLELTIGSHEDLERAKPLILRSYEEN